MKIKKGISRLAILAGLFTIMGSILIFRLYQLQIIEGKSYEENFELRIKKTLTEKAVRGNIYDCSGELLAGNRLVSTITIEDNGTYETDRERQLTLNGTIYRVMKLLKEQGEEPINELKIEPGQDGGYRYLAEGTALARFKADVYGKAYIEDMTSQEAAIDADEMIKYLKSEDMYSLYSEGGRPYTDKEYAEYGLPGKMTEEEELAVIGVRYMLSLNSYQKYLPVTIAREISEKTAAAVMENKAVLQGIDVSEEWMRVYNGGDAFGHILGYTGVISAEEMESARKRGEDPAADDIVGKTGIEYYMDERLQGRDGIKEVYVNNTGKVLQKGEIIREESPGGDVTLSIDKELQEAVYQILEQRIAGILIQNIIDARSFDVTSVADASDIKIPVYDVYYALFDNDVIDMDRMGEDGASALETELSARITGKTALEAGRIRTALENEKADYGSMPEELQIYLTYMLDDFLEWEEDRLDKSDGIYRAWQQGKQTDIRELLMRGIEKGWFAAGGADEGDKYLTGGESYALFLDETLEGLENDKGFRKLVCRQMILSDGISPSEVCRLLYEQGELKEDEDYGRLLSGGISPYDFIIAKIASLQITPGQLALAPCSGSAVITDVNTGKVLACVSYPGYDSSRLANEMDTDYYYKLYHDKSAPFYNKATQQLTAPGSTFKPVTVIEGLQEGMIDYHTALECDGVFDKVEPHLKCWNWSGHGLITGAADALKNSCNDYLCEISYRMGMSGREEFSDDQALEYIQKYASLFDLDKESGIEITESSPQISDHYGIPSAIGQGTHNYSTSQLARYVTTLANQGTSYKLSLIEEAGTQQAPRIESRIDLPPEVWDTVKEGMEEFASSASYLGELNIRTAGKSGTAQESDIRPDHALFVGYAPADAPKIAAAVRIANGYTSGNAVAAAADMFKYYFEGDESVLNSKASQASTVRTD